MSTNKDDQDRKVEGYTRALLEAGRAEGRATADLIAGSACKNSLRSS